jgi:hypothetical protein
MIDNPYSPPDSNLEKAALDAGSSSLPSKPWRSKLHQIGIKTLAWVLIIIGVNGLLNIILFLYEKSNGPHGSAYLFSIQGYSMFLVPALTIQTGLLIKSGSKWAIMTCSVILALSVYIFLKLHYRFSALDQRPIFTQIVDQMPRPFAVHIVGYAFVLGLLVVFWKVGKIK